MGWMAEQTSCLKPSRVSSAVRAPPPIVFADSMTATLSPASVKVMAAHNPLGPLPTTTASNSLTLRSYALGAEERFHLQAMPAGLFCKSSMGVYTAFQAVDVVIDRHRGMQLRQVLGFALMAEVHIEASRLNCEPSPDLGCRSFNPTGFTVGVAYLLD